MSEHTPITGDIRRWWELYISGTMDADLREGFGNLCDAIDAIDRGLEQENERLLRIAGECTSQLRKKHGLGYIVMPMGAAQALCETVAEIVGKRYDMTDEGVEFDG